MNQGFQNNYNYNYNFFGEYDDEYYDENYDLHCDEMQYEYVDAAGNPYLDTYIPAPSILYVKDRIAREREAIRKEEMAKQKRAADLAARRALDEARFAAQEAKVREEKRVEAQLSFFRGKLNTLTLQEIGEAVRNKIYTDETEAKIANEVFMSKLPRFSTAMLAKMKAAEEKAAKTTASEKYTAPNVFADKSVWGHRRNGGGKGRKDTIQIMNSPEKAAEIAAARRIRRKENAKKAAEELAERQKKQEQINAIIAAAKPPPAPVEAVEETEWQKFKREELEAFRVKVATTEYKEVKEVAKEEAAVAKEDAEWTKVVDVKKNKIAKSIECALYATPVCEAVVVAEAVAPKPMSKKVKATIMCRSVAKKEACPHPPGQCNFAHSIDELAPRTCINSRCHFVKNVGEKYINKGRKVCAYLHEGETKHNLCRRLGVDVAETVVSQSSIARSNAPIIGLTPTSTRVLKPYSKDRAWAPVEVAEAMYLASQQKVKKSRWGARK